MDGKLHSSLPSKEPIVKITSNIKASNIILEDINLNDLLKCLEIVIRYILSKNDSSDKVKCHIKFAFYIVQEPIYLDSRTQILSQFEACRSPPWAIKISYLFGSNYDKK